MTRATTGAATEARPNWHSLEVDEALQRLDVDQSQGLPEAQVRRRQIQYGSNSFAEPPKTGVGRLLYEQLNDFMIVVLLVAAGVAALVGDARDALVIIVIVLLNAAVGVFQAFRAEQSLVALRQLGVPTARVRRDNNVGDLSSAELVPGDIVLLEAGDAVPADLRLLEGQQLATDESMLTGESQSISKSIDAAVAAGAPIGDRRNLVFQGSLVTHGHGVGVVVAIGMRTELGRVAELLGATPTEQTPLQRRLNAFGRRLALVTLAICAVLFVVGLLRGEPPVLMFLTAVSLAVAAIPEALPAVVTISLALGAGKMSRRNALVRRLQAVETLGAVTYICTDKTGTLTENHMRVEFVDVEDGRVSCDSAELAKAKSWLLLNLTLCNEVEVDAAGVSHGDPTEVALLEFASRAGFDKRSLLADHPRQRDVPFDSESKRMATVHADDDGWIALVKGAPEVIVPACTAWHGSPSNWSAAEVLAQAETLAGNGYRVLALAAKPLSDIDADVSSDLQLLGLAALQDPPRVDVPGAVAECRAAGITPVMITGDHPGTALAIARQVGIVDGCAESTNDVLQGEALNEMSDEELAKSVLRTRVFARVDPEQKIRIVEALQSNGEYVAMTGDGVNDAPALKRADIGVAMGLKGTDVARKAADMVLLDDNFSTIVSAVREGRRIFDNVLKFIRYTLSSNAGEIWTMLLAPLCGLPVPLLPIHILWINLVTDGLPGLALAAEPAEANLMTRPPREPGRSIFADGMWQHIVWVGLLIGGVSVAGQAWSYGQGTDSWQTIVFTILTFSQLAHVLVIRSSSESIVTRGFFSNLPLVGAVVFTVALQLFVIYVPTLQELFHTVPLSPGELAVCFALPLVVLVAVELQALLRRWRGSHRADGDQ